MLRLGEVTGGLGQLQSFTNGWYRDVDWAHLDPRVWGNEVTALAKRGKGK